MASERELKTWQENNLFQIYFMQEGLRRGNLAKLDAYLKLQAEMSLSGMTADEIDAVRARVSRALEGQDD